MSTVSAEEVRGRLAYGLIPAVPVPFDSRGQVDVDAQRCYIAYMMSQPVAGVAVWAHTGRGLRLSPEQRMQVIRAWSQALGADTLLVAGVGGAPDQSSTFSAFLTSALGMASDARNGGAHAFLVYPPTLFRSSRDADRLVLEYHRELGAIGVPLILFYLYEAAGGFPYSPELLQQLLALPQVSGLKLATLDSVMTFQNVARLIAEECPDKLLITGEDRFLGYSLMCGARAALIGMGAACTSLPHRLLRAYFDGQAREFMALSEKADRLSQVLFVAPVEGYIRRMLWTLVHLGVMGRESAHDPWGPELPESEFEAMGIALRALGEISSERAAGQ